MKHVRWLSFLAIVSLFRMCGPRATGAAAAPSQSETAGSTSTQSSAADTTVRHIEGQDAAGAHYDIRVPGRWNHRLVLYAHGYTPPAAPLSVPGPRELSGLLARGYAVAYSSYSETGYAVKDGAERTHALRVFFRRRIGTPRRTYLIGHSLGGIISLSLLEQHPDKYSGALLLSGVLGGTRAQLDYISNARILFDCFFPGVIPGTLMAVPESADFVRQIAPAIVKAATANMPALIAMASVEQCPVPYADNTELVRSITSVLGFQCTAVHDLLGRIGGGSFFDNATRHYTAPLSADSLARLNACVPRFTVSARAAEYMRLYYEPTGKLRVPVLTLHRPRDSEVPFFHEALYRKRIDQGGAPFLVQRTMVGYGHDNFTPSELLGAFDELVAWAEHGVKPAP